MIFDKQNMFDEDAAITVTRDSTNIIDLGVQTPNMAGSVVGTLDIAIIVKESFTSDGAATLEICSATSATDDLDTPTKLARVTLALADLAVGRTPIVIQVPQATIQRYLGLIYTVGGADPMTAGKISAGIAADVQLSHAYPKNFVAA